MTVSIHIHGENAAQAISELRAVAKELSEAREAGAPVVVGPTPAAELSTPPETSSATGVVVDAVRSTGEVVDLKTADKKRGRPRKTESQPAPSPQVSAETQGVPSPSPAPAPAATEISDADMRGALQRITVKFPGDEGLNKVLALIKEYAGVERVKEIKPEQRAAVYAAAEKALAE